MLVRIKLFCAKLWVTTCGNFEKIRSKKEEEEGGGRGGEEEEKEDGENDTFTAFWF